MDSNLGLATNSASKEQKVPIRKANLPQPWSFLIRLGLMCMETWPMARKFA